MFCVVAFVFGYPITPSQIAFGMISVWRWTGVWLSISTLRAILTTRNDSPVNRRKSTTIILHVTAICPLAIVFQMDLILALQRRS
jgi:hypothetical protein